MQQPAPAGTNAKANTGVSAVNMTTLIRQPLLRVQSNDSMQIATGTNGNLANVQSGNVQNGVNATLANDTSQSQNAAAANQSRVTTLILPSRSVSNSSFAQRSNANQRQNQVTITRMQTTPTPATPAGATTQILYNANFGALNIAPAAYLHSAQPQLQLQSAMSDVNGAAQQQQQQFVVASPTQYRRLGARQCLFGNQPMIQPGQFSPQPSVTTFDAPLQFVQPRTQYAQFTQFAQPSSFTAYAIQTQSPSPNTQHCLPSPNQRQSPALPLAQSDSASDTVGATEEKMQMLDVKSPKLEADAVKREPSVNTEPEPRPRSAPKSSDGVKPRGHHDDCLTNLGWLQDPNLFRLPNLRIGPAASPTPDCAAPISPPTSFCSPPNFRAGNSPPNGRMNTPQSSSSQSFTSPTVSPNVTQSGPQLVHFASQQIAKLAQFGEHVDTLIDDGQFERTEESELVQIAGEVERRDAPFGARFVSANANCRPDSAEQLSLPAFSHFVHGQFTSASGFAYQDPNAPQHHFGSPDSIQFAAPNTPRKNTNANANANSNAPRVNRQRSAPYGAMPRRNTTRRNTTSQPRTRATRKSQQNAAPPTINPRFAIAAGLRPPPQTQGLAHMQRPAFVAAFNHDPLLSADSRPMPHSFTAFARHGEMPFLSPTPDADQGPHGGQTGMSNSLNEEEFADLLRAFENDENNMEMADDSEGVAPPDLDLTVHGVGLKAADLIGLAGGDSFDRLFGFATLNGSANSGSQLASSSSRSGFGSNAHASAGQSPYGGQLGANGMMGSPTGPAMPFINGASMRASLNASLNTPNGPLSLSNSLNVGGPFLGSSLSASATQSNMVIDLMNPDELCFNDERGNEQNDTDLLDSLGDFALDSILGNDHST